MNWDRIMKKWRFMLLLVFLGGSIIQLKPWAGLNLDWGFDIQGGSRVVLKPTNQSVSLDNIVVVLQNRLNVYGLRDIRIRGASDLQSKFVVVEAAGLSEDEIKGLLSSQGNFEAKINNITVFTGRDIKVDQARESVIRTQGGYRYSIPVFLSVEASKRFAQETARLFPTGSGYLDATLDLYIDGEKIDSLQISSDLQGKDVPTASVTGGAATKEEAVQRLNQMVAILMTGSLPTKLETVSVQSVSPLLGSEFLRSTSIAGLFAALFVGLVLFFRYRNAEIVGAILSTALSELVITLGIASFIDWQLDLSAIAGLIITLGTGVDQQIIMTDDVLFGGKGAKVHLKEAMFVIMATFGTMASAMLPLMFIGVGAVRGFAVTTIIGLAVGYFVTRPAYLAVLEEIV